VEGARPATPADVEWLAALARQAIAELSATKGGAMWARREARQEPVDAGLAEAVDDPERLVLCGTIDEAIVGYAAVGIEVLRDGGRLAVLTDLYVEPGARGVGVGEAMMDAVLAWAGARGCIGVDGLALPGLRDTKNFFETSGLVARAIVVHRPLP
jgi:GNAT superfamily N-acetyltransferase